MNAQAPHQAGCSLQQTMNKHFFFLLFRYKLTTPSFFVVQGTDTIDEVRQQKECCPWRPFFLTVPLNAHGITVEHFVLMQDEVDNEIFQAVRQTKLPLDVPLELQNEALIEPAFPHRNAVAIGILLLCR